MRNRPIKNFNLSGTSGPLYFSNYDLDQPFPTITSLSQNAGTINGGSVITVTGTGFLAGMTSTLGTVSAVTPTTCTVTTNAGSAGAFAWTIQDPNGGAVSGPSFTYLAHPGSPTLIPNTGPDNAVQSVIISSSHLPFGFTGVPFSVTVNGVSMTSLVIGGLTAATGNIPSGGSDGAQDVVISVDGATATHTGGYTFYHPGVSSVSPNTDYALGGTPITISGHGFTGATGATLNGVSVTSFVVSNDSTITCVSGATTNPANVGTGNVVVTGVSTGTNLWTYQHDPLTILGASNVFGWYESGYCTQSSGSVTAITDLSGSGNTPTVITSVSYNATDAAFNSQPSWSFNGTTSYMTFGSVTNASSTTLMDFFVMEMKSTATAALLSDAAFGWEIHENGSMTALGDGATAVWGTNTGVLNTATTICRYGTSGGSSDATEFITVANGTAQSGTAAGTGFAYDANYAFTFGARAGASIPMNFTCTCFVRALVIPTGTQLTQLQTYAHQKFGV